MKVLLKIIKWILILLVVLTVLAAGGLYGFLKYGLTGTVQQHVLPEVLTQTGVDAELDHVDLDLFKGAFNLKGLRIKNPAGFVEPDLMTVDSMEVMVRLKSLLTQNPIEVQRIKLQGAKLHIIRNREKALNVQQMQAELAEKIPAQPAELDVSETGPAPEREPGTMPKPGPEPVPAEPMPLPAVVLKALEADLYVDYVDQSDKAPIEQGVITLNVRGRNLATAAVKDIPWGELYLISTISVDGRSFPANFNLLVAPFDQPETLSFDLKGAPFEMDAALVNQHIKELGLESEKVRLEVDVKAREGVIVEPDSVIGTELKGVQLDKSVAGVELSASALKFKLPVSGTVMKPVIDWQDAVQKVVNENQAVLLKEVGSQLLDKAVKPGEKAGIQALAKEFGFDLGLSPADTPAEQETETPQTEDEPVNTNDPDKELSTEEKVLGGVLRVLEESEKDEGEPESKAIEEVLKIFGN